MNKSSIIILSGPSGSGKSTVYTKVEENNFAPTSRVITCTSRAPRVNDGTMEQHGREYYFWSKKDFEENIANGEMLEYAIYPPPTPEKPEQGNLYGSTWKELERIKALGRVPIYIVDVQGAKTLDRLKEKYRVISLFLLPPSMTELRERLKNRDGETPVKIIEERFAAAVHEIALKDTYDLCLINQDAIETAANFGKIVSDIMANVPAKLIRSNYHQEAV